MSIFLFFNGTKHRMNYGRYQIVRELGRGSMGVVYQAHDPQIDRLVALKVLRQDRLTSEAFIQRFLKEARAIGRLSHPNIVTVYDAGQDHGSVYIAMEYLEGEPLNQMMDRDKTDLQQILEVGIQVSETLDYAHQKGIVHRDIKPSNIIVQATHRIKITDFGIAHMEDPSASVQTQAGEILGTPAYMSPEQVMSQPVDGRSDLFSLGVILYEWSTRKRPFRGDNMASVFHAITQETPPPPDRINPAISQSLSQIIMKCLKKRPGERFETGRVLAEALRNCLQEKTVSTLVVSDTPKRSKRVIFFILSAAVLLGIVGTFVLPKLVSRPVPPGPSEKMSSSLKVESLPGGAQVFVDGMFRGKTPLTLALAPGKREIRVTLADHYDWEAQVQVREQEEIPLQVRLISIPEKKP